jgi:hypothetical protein
MESKDPPTAPAGPRVDDDRCPVATWAEWTGMILPDDGTYVFPGGLAPLVVNNGVGVHVEPNVWVLHRLVG